MEIIRTIDRMKQISRAAHGKEHVTGFVPTMGAIHDGHLSLVRAARAQCSAVVVSLFVNPTQFGPAEDFAKYPRTFETDRAALEAAGVDYLFAPPVEEVYVKDASTFVNVEGISDQLEGSARPGHFRGVATIVLKLFEIVQPAFAFFGRKDAQQQAIIRRMTRDLNLDAQIVTCPIARESDGLALSSRNVYLSGPARRAAAVLYRSLDELRKQAEAGKRDGVELMAGLRKVIASEPIVALDYAEIVDAETFEPAMSLRGDCFVVLAARVGSTRLIDNALIEQHGNGFKVTV